MPHPSSHRTQWTQAAEMKTKSSITHTNQVNNRHKSGRIHINVVGSILENSYSVGSTEKRGLVTRQAKSYADQG